MAEMLSIIRQIQVAGSETTASLLADLMVQLARASRRVGAARRPTLPVRGVVVEEGLRWASPNQGLFRIVTADTEIAGTPIPAGSTLWVMYGSADHDDRALRRPRGVPSGPPGTEQPHRLRARHPLLSRRRPRPIRSRHGAAHPRDAHRHDLGRRSWSRCATAAASSCAAWSTSNSTSPTAERTTRRRPFVGRRDFTLLETASSVNNYSSVNQNGVMTSDVSDEFFASVDSRRISTIGRASIVGVVGIIIMYLAIGSLFALEQPPFVGADEKAHLGYAHVVADGSLPTIDQLQPVPVWARQWMSESISTTPFANRTIWVANHPPLYYVSVAPLIWYSELTQRPDGGLLLMRLANIAWGAVGLAFTYADRHASSTKSPRIALVSTGVAAMVTQLYASLSLGMSDGMTFAAGAAVTWAGLRCLQRGSTSRNLWLLALTTAVATGTRAATMLVAFAVVATVAAFEYAKPVAANGDRRRAALRVGVIGLLPAALALRLVLPPQHRALRRHRCVELPARALRSRTERQPRVDAAQRWHLAFAVLAFDEPAHLRRRSSDGNVGDCRGRRRRPRCSRHRPADRRS